MVSVRPNYAYSALALMAIVALIAALVIVLGPGLTRVTIPSDCPSPSPLPSSYLCPGV